MNNKLQFSFQFNLKIGSKDLAKFSQIAWQITALKTLYRSVATKLQPQDYVELNNSCSERANYKVQGKGHDNIDAKVKRSFLLRETLGCLKTSMT